MLRPDVGGIGDFRLDWIGLDWICGQIYVPKLFTSGFYIATSCRCREGNGQLEAPATEDRRPEASPPRNRNFNSSRPSEEITPCQ